MVREPAPGSIRLSEAAARRLLARAAEIDAADAGALSVAQLEEIAREAGISPGAFAAALEREGAPAAPAARRRAPGWVQLCMFGVPDRRTALGFYWLFVAGTVAWPVLSFRLAQGQTPLALASSLGGVAFLTLATWSTSHAIRWLDRHGWDTLP